jgi:hypothetical protein
MWVEELNQQQENNKQNLKSIEKSKEYKKWLCFWKKIKIYEGVCSHAKIV